MKYKERWIQFLIVAMVVSLVTLGMSSTVLFRQNQELNKQRLDISFMKERIKFHEISIITMDKELQIQKDNTEVIMKWNEIQAIKIQQMERRLNKIKQVANASLELGMKNKQTVGYDCLKTRKGKKDTEGKGSK